MMVSLSWYVACIRVAERNFVDADPAAKLHEKSWELFLAVQHLQPDMVAIRQAVNNKFAHLGYGNITEQIGKYHPVGHATKWAPLCMMDQLCCMRPDTKGNKSCDYRAAWV